MWLPFATSLKQTIETMSVKGIYMEEDKKEEIKRRMLLPTMFPWRKKSFYCVMTDRSDKVILPQKNPAGG